jgi:hypothetical protein
MEADTWFGREIQLDARIQMLVYDLLCLGNGLNARFCFSFRDATTRWMIKMITDHSRW